MDCLDELAYQGPWILSIVVAWRLLSVGQWLFFMAFLVGVLLNNQLNVVLKSWIREPRPKPVDLVAAQSRDMFGGIWTWFMGSDSGGLYLSKAHLWGMPSGHAQIAGFAVAFYYLVREKYLRLGARFDAEVLGFAGMCLLAVATLWQRLVTDAHTVAQLLVGLGVGVLFAGTIVYTTRWYIAKNRLAIVAIIEK